MKNNRIVLLIGAAPWNYNTMLKFVESDLNVVGVCVASKKKSGINLSYIWKSIKRRGLFHVLDQILGRMFHIVLFSRKEKALLKKLLDLEKIQKLKDSPPVPIFYCEKYGAVETKKWLSDLKPDIFVIHTGEWVGKLVREIPSQKLVIGGHPGITPLYRGAHSAFWAKYNNDLDNAGYSVFHLDKGVDTGDLIFQESVEFTKSHTYRSHSWLCMNKTAEAQIKIVEKYNNTGEILRNAHKKIPDNSEYFVPGFSHKIAYIVKNMKLY